MNTRRILSTLAVSVALLHSFGGVLAPGTSPDSVKVGALAPPLECMDAKGDMVEWGDFGEKAIILTFHSSSTYNSARALADLAARVGGDASLAKKVAIVVVGVAADEPGIEALLRPAGCEIRVALAPDRGPNQRYGVIAYPTAFILDGERRVVEVVRGYGALFAWRATLASRLGSGLMSVEEYERVRTGVALTGIKGAARATRTLQLVRRLIAAGKLDLARATLTQSVEREAEPGDLTRLLVRLLIADGEIEEAQHWIERLLTSYPSDSRLMAAKAQIAVVTGDLDGAEEILAKIDSDLPEVQLARGLVAEERDQWREAAVQYREALEKMLLLSD